MIKKIKNWYRDWQLSRKIKNQQYVYIVALTSETSNNIMVKGVFSTWNGAVHAHKVETANMGGLINYEILQYPVHQDGGHL